MAPFTTHRQVPSPSDRPAYPLIPFPHSRSHPHNICTRDHPLSRPLHETAPNSELELEPYLCAVDACLLIVRVVVYYTIFDVYSYAAANEAKAEDERGSEQVVGGVEGQSAALEQSPVGTLCARAAETSEGSSASDNAANSEVAPVVDTSGLGGELRCKGMGPDPIKQPTARASARPWGESRRPARPPPPVLVSQRSTPEIINYLLGDEVPEPEATDSHARSSSTTAYTAASLSNTPPSPPDITHVRSIPPRGLPLNDHTHKSGRTRCAILARAESILMPTPAPTRTGTGPDTDANADLAKATYTTRLDAIRRLIPAHTHLVHAAAIWPCMDVLRFRARAGAPASAILDAGMPLLEREMARTRVGMKRLKAGGAGAWSAPGRTDAREEEGLEEEEGEVDDKDKDGDWDGGEQAKGRKRARNGGVGGRGIKRSKGEFVKQRGEA